MFSVIQKHASCRVFLAVDIRTSEVCSLTQSRHFARVNFWHHCGCSKSHKSETLIKHRESIIESIIKKLDDSFGVCHFSDRNANYRM